MACTKRCKYGCGCKCNLGVDNDNHTDKSFTHSCLRKDCPGRAKLLAEREEAERVAKAEHLQEFVKASLRMRQAFDAKLDAFLKTPRMSENGGWSKVEDQDMEDLTEIIQLLIDMKFERDGENDPSVEFDLVDRNKYERMHFVPVPYSAWKSRDKDGATEFQVLEAAELNVAVAMERFKSAFKMFQYQERDKAKEKKDEPVL